MQKLEEPRRVHTSPLLKIWVSQLVQICIEIVWVGLGGIVLLIRQYSKSQILVHYIHCGQKLSEKLVKLLQPDVRF